MSRRRRNKKIVLSTDSDEELDFSTSETANTSSSHTQQPSHHRRRRRHHRTPGPVTAAVKNPTKKHSKNAKRSSKTTRKSTRGVKHYRHPRSYSSSRSRSRSRSHSRHSRRAGRHTSSGHSRSSRRRRHDDFDDDFVDDFDDLDMSPDALSDLSSCSSSSSSSSSSESESESEFDSELEDEIEVTYRFHLAFVNFEHVMPTAPVNIESYATADSKNMLHPTVDIDSYGAAELLVSSVQRKKSRKSKKKSTAFELPSVAIECHGDDPELCDVLQLIKSKYGIDALVLRELFVDDDSDLDDEMTLSDIEAEFESKKDAVDIVLVLEVVNEGNPDLPFEWVPLSQALRAQFVEPDHLELLVEWFGFRAVSSRRQRSRRNNNNNRRNRANQANQANCSFEIPEKRVAWALPGFAAHINRWVMQQVEAKNMVATGALEQFDNTSRASLFRIQVAPSSQPHVRPHWWYVKSCPHISEHEVPFTVAISQHLPAITPRVVAFTNGTTMGLPPSMILDEIEGKLLEDIKDLQVYKAFAAELAKFQIACMNADLQRQLGAPTRSLSSIVPYYRMLVTKKELELSRSERRQLQSRTKEVSKAVRELKAFDIPLSVEHGDMQAGNVFVRGTVSQSDAEIVNAALNAVAAAEAADEDFQVVGSGSTQAPAADEPTTTGKGAAPTDTTGTNNSDSKNDSVIDFTIFDFGDVCISHPFFSMVTLLEDVPSKLRDPLRNNRIVSVPEVRTELLSAYLAPFVQLLNRSQTELEDAFEAAERVAIVHGAINACTIMVGSEDMAQDDMDDELEEFFEDILDSF
jgi:hypothetical protein